ncbi:MAG: phosphotransferase [Alicyclobacillus sp.]|nr:phosphotransferase [Alicyclobacillus sp.]
MKAIRSTGSTQPNRPRNGVRSPAWTVVRAYGLTPRRVRPLASAYRAAAATLVVTDRIPVVVKAYGRSPERLEALARRMQHLQEGGYSHLPTWLRTTSGARYVTWNGRLYYVTRYVDGYPLRGQPDALWKLGQALGRLHRFPWGRAFPVSADHAAYRPMPDMRRQLAAFRDALQRAAARRGRVFAWLRQHGPDFLEMAEQSLRFLGDREAQRVLSRGARCLTWLHGDVTRPNVRVARAGEIVLLDWENMKPGLPWRELARALNNTCDFQPDAISALLRGYQSEVKLDDGERRLVAGFALWPLEVMRFATAVTSAPGATERPSSSLRAPEFHTIEESAARRLALARYLATWADGDAAEDHFRAADWKE